MASALLRSKPGDTSFKCSWKCAWPGSLDGRHVPPLANSRFNVSSTDFPWAPSGVLSPKVSSNVFYFPRRVLLSQHYSDGTATLSGAGTSALGTHRRVGRARSTATAGVAEVAIRVLTYIDNFYLLADSTSTLEMAEKVLLELCDEARIVINREQQPESGRHTNIFIGIEWNERDLTCTLSPKSAKKLTSLLSFTQLWYHTPVPLRQVLEVFGFLIFAARVTGQGQAPLYGVLKFLRRNGKKNVSEICWVRPSVISSFNEYIVNLAYTPARVLLAPLDEECGQSRVITLFTDACPSG